MKRLKTKKLLCILLVLAMALLVAGCGLSEREVTQLAGDVLRTLESFEANAENGDTVNPSPTQTVKPEATPQIEEAGAYTERDEVALYIHTYGKLPGNFVTKDEARERGWNGGSLEPYCPGCSIGGDRFGNREGLLPKADGRSYTECDIGTMGAKERGAKRIVFSNDGLIYYTDDHYASFQLLYGEE